MSDIYHRTRLLTGDTGVERLQNAAVAIIGLGGVGGYAAEVIARAGVGRLLLIDADKVDITNINRQLYALYDTIEQKKVDVARKRIGQINPDAVARLQQDLPELFAEARIYNLPVEDVMGLFGDGLTARFKDVETRPEYRRRGVCRTLLYRLCERWTASRGPAAFVISPEDDSVRRVYEAVGFGYRERVADLCLRPPEA